MTRRTSLAAIHGARGLALAAFALTLSACNVAEDTADGGHVTEGKMAATASPVAQETAAPAAPAQRTQADASTDLHWLVAATGSECKDARTGDRCMAGDYDIELSPDCGTEGFFAGVSQADGAVVLNGAPPTDTRQLATLPAGQFVCIQAIARAGQDPRWYYVAAIPVDSVAACRGNALCTQYGDREIKRTSPATGGGCHVIAPGRYGGDCVQGWVRATALDVFSNGL